MCFLAFTRHYYHNFSFQSDQLLFSYTSAEVRGENAPERKLASTGDQTHNHQVMSPTYSPLRHLGGVHLLEKEKMLVTSIYCYTTNIYLPSLEQFLLIKPFPNKPWFLSVCSTSLLKTLWEKEKLLVMSNFSLSHSVFYPFKELSAICMTP